MPFGMSSQQMIRLNKLPKPAVLVANETTWSADYLIYKATGSPKSAARRYRDGEIKAEVQRETSDKCAYCESKVSHTYPGDVEHILPKSARPDLFVQWENLTYVCFQCNNEKRDYYEPAQPLLNPYQDDPQSHVQFLGPMCLEMPGSARGQLTVLRLQLSRPPLVERRKDGLEAVLNLARLWIEMPPGPQRDAVRDQVLRYAEPEAEYSAAVRAFISSFLGWT